MSSSAVVLTPDASTSRLLKIFERVQVPPAFKRMGSTFGPYPLSWERKDDDEVEELCRHFPGEGDLLVSDALSAARSIATPDRRRIVESIDLRRSLSGDTHITREALKRLIDDAIRKARRFAPRAPSGRRIMTIARAKNREFRDVIVVWPQTVPADIAYQRRLLYNGVTRAQTDCCVVVLGQGRLSKPPFV